MLIAIIEFVAIVGLLYWLNNYLRRNLVDNFADKSVFVTGTDTGIGRQVALELDRRGLTVYAGCYTGNGGESLRMQASSKLKIVSLDVTDNNSIKNAKQYIESTLPSKQGLWALVNNAGILNGIVFEWSTIEDYENTMDVNFYGIIRVTNAFLPLVKRAGGRIVNLLSMAGRLELVPGPYSCSKFAAEAYCTALRRHVSSFGVKVSIIEPGCMPTNMMATSALIAECQRQWNNLSDSVKRDNAYTEDFRKKIEADIEKLVGNYPLSGSNTVAMVVDAIVHAIGSEHPKARYVCGLDASILYRPAAAVLPDWFLDFVLPLICRR